MNKFVVIAVAAALAPAVPVFAADQPAGLAACGEITDSQARLACFDRELARTRPPVAAPAAAAPAAAAPTAPAAASAAHAAPPAAVATIAPSAAPAAGAATPSFGGEGLPDGTAGSEDQRVMHAHVVSQKEISSTRVYNVFLDNGQVWRHEDAHLGSYVRAGNAVTITKHSLGVYRMTRDDGKSKNWIKVTRVR